MYYRKNDIYNFACICTNLLGNICFRNVVVMTVIPLKYFLNLVLIKNDFFQRTRYIYISQYKSSEVSKMKECSMFQLVSKQIVPNYLEHAGV